MGDILLIVAGIMIVLIGIYVMKEEDDE